MLMDIAVPRAESAPALQNTEVTPEVDEAFGAGSARLETSTGPSERPSANHDFRFYDNRQKYLMFVNTCSEKWVVAERVALELDRLRPRPPALRFFDAGMGDGTVLARVMRAMHQRFPRFPFYIAGKEISLEDIRLTLDKMPDRFLEHPETLLAITNISYAEAPWLTPANPAAREALNWKVVPLRGSTTAEFERQILALQPFLTESWRTKVSERTGFLVPETPTVLILYREDCGFLLDGIVPERGRASADFDLVLASQPFRLRAPTEFKADRVLAPLARALRPGGRLLGIHSAGNDPGLEIIQRVWPGEDPFTTSRDDLVEATRKALGSEATDFHFDALPHSEAPFRYEMHTLPDEIDAAGASIGTSTLFAAWNAATYVAQIEDERLAEAMANSRYLDATRAVLRKHGGLWFNDESYVIARVRQGG
jgi:SAM-dependent methyltransferase